MKSRIQDMIGIQLQILADLCNKYAAHLREACQAELALPNIRKQLTDEKLRSKEKLCSDPIFEYSVKTSDTSKTYNIEFADLFFTDSKLFIKMSAVHELYKTICMAINADSKAGRVGLFNNIRKVVAIQTYREQIKAPRFGSTDPDKTKGAKFLKQLDAEINSTAYEFAKTELDAHQTFVTNMIVVCERYLMHLAAKKSSHEEYVIKKHDMIKELLDKLKNRELVTPDFTTSSAIEIITSEKMKATINAHKQSLLYYLFPATQSASSDLLIAFNNEIKNLGECLKLVAPRETYQTTI